MITAAINGAAKAIIERGVQASLGLVGERGRRAIARAMARTPQHLLEQIETVETRHGPIRFYCLGDLPLWRARTFFTKEPETLNWIDNFDPGDVFWDIGANIGLYALYAARRGCHVIAFEPLAPNYFLLNRTIEQNGLFNIDALCVAFSDTTILNKMVTATTELGGADSTFNEAGDRRLSRFHQGAIGFTIDDFIVQFSPRFPHHIKIDVDGTEDKIIAGATRTLRDPRIKSLSIEMDSADGDYVARVKSALADAGFDCVGGLQSFMISESQYRSIFNYHFRRR